MQNFPRMNHHRGEEIIVCQGRPPSGPILRFSTTVPLDNKTNHGSLETLARSRNSHARYVGTLAVNAP